MCDAGLSWLILLWWLSWCACGLANHAQGDLLFGQILPRRNFARKVNFIDIWLTDWSRILIIAFKFINIRSIICILRNCYKIWYFCIDRFTMHAFGKFLSLFETHDAGGVIGSLSFLKTIFVCFSSRCVPLIFTFFATICAYFFDQAE